MISPSRHGVRGVKVSPVVIEQARQLIEGGMSYRQVGDKLGVAPQTLYVYIPVPGGTGRRRATGKSGPVIKIMPPAAEEFVSLRQGIMDVLIEKEKVGTVAVLVDYLRQRPNIGPVDLHNVTHLLYMMTKQEQVTFTTTRNGHDVFLCDLRPGVRAIASKPAKAAEVAPSAPETPAAAVAAAPSMAEWPVVEFGLTERPLPTSFIKRNPSGLHPILDQLRNRGRSHKDAIAKAEEAISILRTAGLPTDGLDTATLSLMENEPQFTPVEVEYLAYASAHHE